MPRSEAFKRGQESKRNLSSKPERPPVDAYGNVRKEMETDEDYGSGDGVAVAEMAPPPAPQPEPLPLWLQNFKRIPIDRIRPGIYQKRLPEARERNKEKDLQLEAQMRASHERNLLHLDIAVMPDPDEPGVYNPSQGMHRRIEVARKLGFTELLCFVQEYDRESLAQGTYFENSEFARLNLNIIEEGLFFQQAMEDDPLLTQEGVAELFLLPESGGREHVKVCLAAARAMPDVQELVYKDPERATRVVSVLNRLDELEDCVAKRAPVIQAFLEGRLTVDQVTLLVEAMLEHGEEFTLDETKAKKGVSTPRTIGRIERAIAARKGFTRYFNMIGNDPPSPSERVELEVLRDQINTVLSRQ